MLDRILAGLALGLLVAFLLIAVGFVKEVDLTIVTVIVVLMAAREFWVELRGIGRSSG